MIRFKIIAWILDLFGWNGYLNTLEFEIKCNKEYIYHLENEFIPGLERKIQFLKQELLDEKNNNLNNDIEKEIYKYIKIYSESNEKNILKNEIAELKKVNKKLYQLRGEFCANKWISCNSMLPSISVPELLVTDGNISSVASFDISTKSFLRVFGSQTMRIPFPTAWQLIPAAPDDKIDHYIPPKIDRRKGLEVTYIRD